MNPLIDHLNRLANEDADEIRDRPYRDFIFKELNEDEPVADPPSWYFPLEELDEDTKLNQINYYTYHEICYRLLVSGGKLSVESFANIYHGAKKRIGSLEAPRIFVYDLCACFFQLTVKSLSDEGVPQLGLYFEKLLKLFPALVRESDEVRRLKIDFGSESATKSFLEEMEELYFAEVKKYNRLAKDYGKMEDCSKFIHGGLKDVLEAQVQDGIREQAEVDNIEHFAYDVKTTSLFVTVQAPLFFRGREITPIDQNPFFSQIKCDVKVPYACAIYEGGSKRIMVYTGNEVKKPIPYRKMVKTKKRNERPYIIELFVGIPFDSRDRNPFYYSALVDFQTGTVQVRLQSPIYERYASDLVSVFADLGADIGVGDFTVISTSSQITMTMPDDFRFDDYVFHHLVLTNPLFRNIFYFNERTTPASKRKIIKFYCVPFGGQSIRNAKGELYTAPVAVSLSLFSYVSPSGQSTIRLRLFLSKVTQITDHVARIIIDCLLYYYVGTKYGSLKIEGTPEPLAQIADVRNLYRIADLLPEETELKKGIATQSLRKNKLQLQILQEDYPYIFGHDYMLSCKGKAVPTVFTDENLARKELRDALIQGRNVESEPTPFPNKDNPELWVVSLNDKFPRIILVPNEDEKTQVSYPLVPCAVDKIPRTLRNAAAKTREYVQTTDKFLEPGSFRQGNELLVNLFGVDFLHSYGVNYHEENQKNSLFHCFLFACDKRYRRLFVGHGLEKEIIRSNKLREEYISQVRANHDFNPNICKQELYELTEEEIKQAFLNEDTFLDSSRFYRIFEEFFPHEKINIFVFTNERDSSGSRKLRLEIPRASAYHCREIQLDRKSLILIRNYGPTSFLRAAGTTYPQYEIVCQRIDKEPENLLFGRKVTEICYNVLRQTQKSVVWTPEKGQLQRLEGISFAHRWHEKLGSSINYQFIDPAGYTRIITFTNELGKISIVVPPCQPLNCPVKRGIVRVSEEVALRAFGSPTGCSFAPDGKVQGLWFPYFGIRAGVFCIVKQFSSDKYERIASDPLQEINLRNSVVNEIINFQNQAQIIRQLVTWLYSLAGRPPAEDFIVNYFAEGTEQHANYNFNLLPTTLSEITTPEEGIAHLEKFAPSFISDGKIYLATPSLYERLCYFVRNHEKDYFASKEVRPDSIRLIEQSILNNRGFIKFFKSRLDFENWIDDMEENQGKTLSVHKKFSEATFHKKLVHVVKIPDGYFLVKNLPENSRLSDAERYGGNWIETGLFDGYRTPEKKYPIMQYVVTANQQAEHYANSGDYQKGDPRYHPIVEGEPFVRVLVYGNAREVADERESHAYAVLLPLP